MTRRIHFKDVNGATYVCLDASFRSAAKVVEIRLDYLLSLGLVLFLLGYFAALECVRPHFFLHYHDDHVWCPVPASGHWLEVRYFDSAFRAGLMLLLELAPVAAVTLAALGWLAKRRRAA